MTSPPTKLTRLPACFQVRRKGVITWVSLGDLTPGERKAVSDELAKAHAAKAAQPAAKPAIDREPKGQDG